LIISNSIPVPEKEVLVFFISIAISLLIKVVLMEGMEEEAVILFYGAMHSFGHCCI
jgi:hypothetical protein